MASSSKRKADEDVDSGGKRTKTRKQWRVPRQNNGGSSAARVIQPGDSGIWVTCNRNKEGKCVAEMRDLLEDYAERLYDTGVKHPQEQNDGDHDSEDADIEDAINAEVSSIRRPVANRLFTSMRLDVQCVVFFKTVAPVEPVSLVKRICEDAMENQSLKRTRWAKRLSPMTLIGRASSEGLEKVAREVLQPHFHQEPIQKKKFAIRPTLRNHNILSRDSIIKQVASLVGRDHEVDLKNYDVLIVVEVYQNVCGVSVVDASFERLKRFNIAEIFDPTPVDGAHDDNGRRPADAALA